MIRSLYYSARERRWDRDRGRRVAAMLARERASLADKMDYMDAMAMQLLEIRTLPEAVEPRR